METLNFKDFATRMNEFLGENFTDEAFTTNITGDEVWNAYLDAFPEGTNEIFRERRYHDGSYDRNTIRTIGNLVTFKGGEIVSIWDCPDLEYPYNEVAGKLSTLVKSKEIKSFFRTKFSRIGNKSNVDNLNTEIIWDHFLFDIPRNLVVRGSDSVETVVGHLNESRAMLLRAVTELKTSALDTILELIDSNNLYRGQEYKNSVAAMRDAMGMSELDTWRNASKQNIARFRNTVIGTLAVDLSEGMDIEVAVKRFEDKVAPHNYKRPKAIITQAQVDKAMRDIQELGLEASLGRRLAVSSDLSVNDVLWVNNETKEHMKDGIRSLLEASVAQKPVDSSKAKDISIKDFMDNIAPKSSKIEAFVSSTLTNNLMTLTAPVNSEAPPLFKWDSGFAWSYNGDVADSIRERVIKAGGGVEGVLRVSLAWDNGDDLDLHCKQPDGVWVYYGNRLGILDVDMNAGGATNPVDPVENMIFQRLRDGVYEFYVHNYNRRGNDSLGHTIQVEVNGVIKDYTLNRQLNHKERIAVVEVDVKNGQVINVKPSPKMVGTGISKDVWGIKTEGFVPVTMIMNSPNHWENSNKTGNKHTFFILEGCKNPEPVRGIYNEFLKEGLEQHRRVFEVLGKKSRCEVSDEQLSGLGLSSTLKNSIILRADGRTFNVIFGE